MSMEREDRDRRADDDLARRYRDASDEAGERPGAAARASILAAAAREVRARPVDAASAHVRHRPRWPLAAAAAVMLSTLAVMLAIRTDEEMPQFSPPHESAARAEPASPIASPSPSPLEKQRQADQQVAEKTRVDKAQPAARSVEPVPPAPRESDGAADKPTAARSSPANAFPETQGSAAAPPAPAAPPAEPKVPAASAKLRANEAEAGLAAQAPAQDRAGNDSRRDAARSTAPAPSVAQSERAEATDATESASAWLDRIIKLRREGRAAEAELELERFRKRYPQVQVPAEALAPTGTR